jgi:hypothetical protein
MSLAVLLLGGLVAAQGQGPEVIELDTRDFAIPIHITPGRRNEVKELLLYVSEDQGKSWCLASRVTPDCKEFVFRAQKDGVYWFSVVVIDPQGRKEPPDILTAPPGQRVLVRTTGKGKTSTADGLWVRMLDARIEGLRDDLRTKEEQLRQAEELRRRLREGPQ